jgi:hypothetical protein
MSDSPDPIDDPEDDPEDDPADDPEIAALLGFEPVPRKISQPNGWTPEVQRRFIARLAVHGSICKACREVGKDRSGATKLYNSREGGSFRAAWHAAIELAQRRRAARVPGGPPPRDKPPTIDNRRKKPLADGDGEELPRQALNEAGEWEDEGSFQRRAEDARDSVSLKLQRARRLFLHAISDCPAKRAAFEILTELPVDWALAGQCLPQADEPWRKPAARDPDLLLAAEDGWLGEFVHGPDKKAELLAEINEWRAARGLEPVGWRGEGDSADDESAATSSY